MVFIVKSKKDKLLQKIYDSSMRDLNKFFGFKWIYNKPNLFVVPDRKTIDHLRDRKTEDWIVGWSIGKDVYILDRTNFEKESNHKYHPKTYSALIKHEIVHAFVNVLNEGKNKPKWLDEGVASCLSGQSKFKNRRPKKFSKFLSCYHKFKGGAYGEAGFAVQLLLDNYGKAKLMKLIKSLKHISSKKEFNKKFKEIYGFEPNYEWFNSLLAT